MNTNQAPSAISAKPTPWFQVSRSPARATLQALCREQLVRKAQGRGYLVAGTAPANTVGRLATLDAVRIQPAPLWERVYAEVELQLARHVLFRPVRLTEEKLAEHFGVSRTVARDVLARMQSVGLVGKVPPEFLGAAPYLATIIAVAGFVGRVRPPAADGEPYVKG